MDDRIYATTLNFYIDVSLNHNFGIGGIFENRFFISGWLKNFIREKNPGIEFVELLALTAGILTWGQLPELQNTRMIIFCDNTSVRSMVNNLTTGCKHSMKLSRLLVLDGLRHNWRIFVQYVKSKDNFLADPLSRMDLDTFWWKTPPTMNP